MIADTAKVYLRNSASPYAIVDSSKSLINSNGESQFNFTNVTGSAYYLVLTHRNSIETWSSMPVSFSAGILSYDFTDDSGKAFGSNMKLADNAPAVFAVYSGDVNQDDFINLNDITIAFNNSANFVSGYVDSDLNGDNLTNLNDILIAYNNSNMLISLERP